ncbi:YEATS domain-containing protein 4 [Nematocida sp. AWRm80]|nr:YEATS domain-containing protein 4 [Nematocida sp. AWRm80]
MRINHTNLSRSIIYGTTATRVSDSPTEATHKWKVYVRGYKNQDLSYFIRSVTFKIHETFANPTRTVTTPPFEVEEYGWGEFTIQGRIYFTDIHEKPVVFLLGLKLHKDPTNRRLEDIPYPENTIINERLDTIIFDSPTEATYKILTTNPEPPFEPEIENEIEKERSKIEEAIDYIITKLKTNKNTHTPSL